MLLLDHLIKQFPTAKRETLKRMLADRRVSVNGVVAHKLKQPIGEKDIVQVAGQPAPVRPKKSGRLPFPIVFEDDDVLVINKPPGLLTSTVPREPRKTALALVYDYLSSNDPKAQVGLIHRLDRDASGLLVFSKNDKAYQSLKSQFFHHTVTRIYTAVVSPSPNPAQGRIESNLVEWADGTVRTTRFKGKGQPATTEYKMVEKGDGFAVLRVMLETGRKHQIRAHFVEKGCPVVGDSVYGGAKADGLMLAATELEFDHPRTGARQKFQIPWPPHIADFLRRVPAK